MTASCTETERAMQTAAVPTCAACHRRTGSHRRFDVIYGRGILCMDCGPRVPRPLIVAYLRALHAVRFEGLPDRVLEVAADRLLAAARSEPPPEPPATAPAPNMTSRISVTCVKCAKDFTYTYAGTGRRRTRCDDCMRPTNAAKPAAQRPKREQREQVTEREQADPTIVVHLPGRDPLAIPCPADLRSEEWDFINAYVTAYMKLRDRRKEVS